MLKKAYSKTKPQCKVTFTLPLEAAPQAQEVRVLGQFNDWKWEQAPVLKKNGTEFQAEVELPTGSSFEFRYLIDSNQWENDWKADDYRFVEELGIYNSIVTVDAQATAKKAAPKAKATAASAAPKASEAPKAAPAPKAAKKKATAKKVTAKKDDLKKIEGIGPKIEGLLHKAGITTFTGLAEAKVAMLQDVLTAAGPRFKMHKPATWGEQALLAAAGKWAQLDTLQKELDGGKRK